MTTQSMSEKEMREAVPKSSIFRLLPFLKPEIGRLAVALLMVLVVNAAELIKPYILEVVIDDFLVAGKAESGLYSIAGMSAGYLLCVILSTFLSVAQSISVNKMGQNTLLRIRRQIFGHIQRMPMRLLDHFSSGRLITRATNDIESLNEFFTDFVVNVFRDVFLIVGIMAMMFLMNWRLAFVAMAVVPLITALAFYVRNLLRKNFVKVKALIGRINGFFAENISGMRLVQIFRREKEKLSEFKLLNNEYFKAMLVQMQMNSFMRPMMEMLNTLGIALLVWYGFGQITQSSLEIGVLYAFTNYIKQFFDPINELAEQYTTVQSAAVSTARIYELLDAKDELEDLDAGTPMPNKPAGCVEFRHVWFAYEPENWVLKDVSFVIEPGQSVAFVGATGAGKTTIISLISRFYEIDRGEILLDGVDIRTLRLSDLRRHVAVVLQDVFLFTGSIDENIRLNDQNISDADISRALKLSYADEFIHALPKGIHEPVAERGNTFSAGQRQLLSFARAIAHDPAVFVLDEATANIDTQTELLVQQSLLNVSQGRTTIIIAHRLSTIRHCDCIFVMDHGQIVESGNHEQLMEKNGVYAGLHNALSTEKAAS